MNDMGFADSSRKRGGLPADNVPSDVLQQDGKIIPAWRLIVRVSDNSVSRVYRIPDHPRRLHAG